MQPLHHDPELAACIRFHRCRAHIVLSPSSVVRGGLEPTTDDVSDRHASFTTPDSHQSGRWDSNPRSRVPKTRGLAAALHPGFSSYSSHLAPRDVAVSRSETPTIKRSERPDLNRRSPGPRPGAIPGFATFCFFRLPLKHPVGESNPYWRIESPLS